MDGGSWRPYILDLLDLRLHGSIRINHCVCSFSYVCFLCGHFFFTCKFELKFFSSFEGMWICDVVHAHFVDTTLFNS